MPKITALLAALAQRLAADDIGAKVDVVVAPSAPAASQAAAEAVRACGGEPAITPSGEIECRIAVGDLSKLAESADVSSVRPARTHRMH